MNLRLFLISILIVLFIYNDSLFPQSFREKQRNYPRVNEAYLGKDSSLISKLSEQNLNFSDINIMFVAFKKEKEFELWIKQRRSNEYSLLTTYPICATSGSLGPKRKQGDRQIPEGFYNINDFNPNSNFHLSLGISYPNRTDRRLTKFNDPGGSIYIHGSCVTIGCLPLTNDIIKEIYIFAVEARNNGQTNIPVYIFPFRMDEENYNTYTEIHKENPEILGFWANIKEGYDLFYSGRRELNYNVNRQGKYIFNR